MEAYGSISPQPGLENKLTPEEAQAVIGLWSLQHRLNEDAFSKPTVNDIAESLSIPPDEVRRYLDQVRASQGTQARKPRSLRADVTLALAAMVLLAIIAISASSYFARRQTRYFGGPFPVASTFSSEQMAPEFYDGTVPRTLLIRSSTYPNRFSIGVGSVLYRPESNLNSLPVNDRLRRSLIAAIGGPLADRSSLASGTVNKSDVARAIASGPGTVETPAPPDGRGGDFISPPPASETNTFLQWKKVQVAYGGKVVEAQVPYSRLANADIRNLVDAEQTRVIDVLVENVMALVKK